MFFQTWFETTRPAEEAVKIIKEKKTYLFDASKVHGETLEEVLLDLSKSHKGEYIISDPETKSLLEKSIDAHWEEFKKLNKEPIQMESFETIKNWVRSNKNSDNSGAPMVVYVEEKIRERIHNLVQTVEDQKNQKTEVIKENLKRILLSFHGAGEKIRNYVAFKKDPLNRLIPATSNLIKGVVANKFPNNLPTVTDMIFQYAKAFKDIKDSKHGSWEDHVKTTIKTLHDEREGAKAEGKLTPELSDFYLSTIQKLLTLLPLEKAVEEIKSYFGREFSNFFISDLLKQIATELYNTDPDLFGMPLKKDGNDKEKLKIILNLFFLAPPSKLSDIHSKNLVDNFDKLANLSSKYSSLNQQLKRLLGQNEADFEKNKNIFLPLVNAIIDCVVENPEDSSAKKFDEFLDNKALATSLKNKYPLFKLLNGVAHGPEDFDVNFGKIDLESLDELKVEMKNTSFPKIKNLLLNVFDKQSPIIKDELDTESFIDRLVESKINTKDFESNFGPFVLQEPAKVPAVELLGKKDGHDSPALNEKNLVNEVSGKLTNSQRTDLEKPDFAKVLKSEIVVGEDGNEIEYIYVEIARSDSPCYDEF